MDNKTSTTMEKAMQLTTAIAVPMALKATMELSLLDIIEKAGPPGTSLSPSDIVASLDPPASNHEHASDMVDRILRLLSSYDVVTCSVSDYDDGENKHEHGQVKRVYGLGALACHFVQSRDDRPSLAPLFHTINDQVVTGAWHHMKDAILQGQVPFKQAYGKTAKELVDNDKRFGPIFYSSMKDYNTMFMDEILGVYKGFEGLKSIVDVGGGNGSVLKAIISKYPTIKGVNFDLPKVIKKLDPCPGIENVAGDMHTSTIPKADAIFAKWVLKHLDDEPLLKVLKRFYGALLDGGKLMIVELMIPNIPNVTTNSTSVFQFDIYLTSMNSFATGKERTFGEIEALAKAAGFSGIQAAITAYDMTLLEFHKISSVNHQ